MIGAATRLALFSGMMFSMANLNPASATEPAVIDTHGRKGSPFLNDGM